MIRDRNQLRAMLQLMRSEHKRMTPQQFKTAIATVGLTQEAAGVFFGYSKRPGQAWALGERAVPWPVQCALEFMVKHKLTATDL